MTICQTIMTPTLAALCAARTRVALAGTAAMVEVRLDGLAPEALTADAVATALGSGESGPRLPAVVTCRPVWEGGRFAGTEAQRLGLLADAARLGAAFVDIEAEALARSAEARDMAAKVAPARLVISHHNFTPGVPADLTRRVREMRAVAAQFPGAVVKIAITAARPADCAVLRRAALDGAATLPAGTLAIAMGSAGRLTRMVPAKFSNTWTYVGDAAPGQFDIDAAIAAFRLDTATERTRVFAITGAPLGHSASPAMHTAAFKSLGLDAVLVPIETADVEELFQLLDALDVEGVAVTAPLKAAVFAHRGVSADDAARAIGAVNTLRRAGAAGPGHLSGPAAWDARNFDAAAFRWPLDERGVDLRGRRALVLGAGGAARAAVTVLAAMGAAVEVAARDPQKTAAFAAALGVAAAAPPLGGDAAIVVNATPVGTAPNINASPIAAGAVRAPLAYDLVYNPQDTQFLKDARHHGATAIGGLAMLAAQAASQCEWWTGARIAPEVFARAAQEFLQ